MGIGSQPDGSRGGVGGDRILSKCMTVNAAGLDTDATERHPTRPTPLVEAGKDRPLATFFVACIETEAQRVLRQKPDYVP